VYDQNYKFLFGTLTPNDTVSEPIAQLVTEKNPNIKRVAIQQPRDIVDQVLDRAGRQRQPGRL